MASAAALALRHADKVVRVHMASNKGYDPLQEVKKDNNQDSMLAWLRMQGMIWLDMSHLLVAALV